MGREKRKPPDAALVVIPRAEVIRLWAEQLKAMRGYRAHDLKLAKARDAYEALGRKATETVFVTGPAGDDRPPTLHPVEAIPAPSPGIEKVRVSGKLAAEGYNPHKVKLVEPVEWRWARHASRVLDDDGIAEALAQADGLPWPPKNMQAKRDAVYQLLKRALKQRRP